MTEKCIINGCSRPAGRRGLCLICYSVAKRKVENNETTWDALVEVGLAQESPDSSPFEKEFKRLSKNIAIEKQYNVKRDTLKESED